MANSNVKEMRADSIAADMRSVVDGLRRKAGTGDYIVRRALGGIWLSKSAAKLLSDEYIKLAEDE